MSRGVEARLAFVDTEGVCLFRASNSRLENYYDQENTELCPWLTTVQRASTDWARCMAMKHNGGQWNSTNTGPIGHYNKGRNIATDLGLTRGGETDSLVQLSNSVVWPIPYPDWSLLVFSVFHFYKQFAL